MRRPRPTQAPVAAPAALRLAAIRGLGVYVPTRVLTNDDLSRIVDTSDAWIVERTGIRARHIAAPDQAASDLGVAAARAALADARLEAGALDLIICATTTPDMLFPATACLIQDRLGARRAGAFDLLAACSSFVYGVITAAQAIEAGAARHVMVVGAEVLSRFVDWTDRSLCVLVGDGAGAARHVMVVGAEVLSRFVDWTDRSLCVLVGDGAGAAILGPAEGGGGVRASVVGADGGAGDMLKLPGGGSRMPYSDEVLRRGLHYPRMDGRTLFKLAVRVVPDAIAGVVRRAGWSLDQVRWIVPHQANQRILEAVARHMDLPIERFVSTIARYGNTSSASVPISLWEARRDGRITDGDRLVLAAFGGGFTWAACALTWGR